MRNTAADAIAEAMVRHGVREVFGQSLPSAFLLAAEERGIRQVTYRTENAGGAMADGYARVAHRPAVVAAQNGPAATLLVPPLAEAMKSSTAIVAIVQDVPVEFRDRNAFQELDHFTLFASCAKWVRRLDDPERADDYVDMAFTAAAGGRPGPAVLLVPKDVLGRPSAEPQAPVRRTARLDRVPLDRPRPDSSAVREAAELLAQAQRPVVIAGGGVHGSDACAQLAALQQTAALPVFTTPMGKGAVAEDHPLSAGVMGHFMGPRGMTHGLLPWLAEADAVLLVGTRTNENGTDGWRTLPRGACYAHLDVSGAEIGRNYEALRLVGDARAGLSDLLDELARVGLSKRHAARGETEEAIARARGTYRESTAEVTGSDAAPVRPERVMAELDALLTPGTVVVSDASYSSVWTANYLHARRAGQRFLSPRGLAGLGWGLPMALGARTARPEDPVVCVTGDGGFAHVWAELETAVRERLPVAVLLLDNQLLGYQQHAEVHQFSRATSAVGMAPVQYAALAESCGAVGLTVRTAQELQPALQEALSSDRPVLVDIMTDPHAFPPLTGWEDDPRLAPLTL
ncbi:acetolactate synthase catalytic subunit [Streptomyces sp. NPDC058000]|uniref:acetolactate synthase catalytic subunit n=1 Tax=Streptomyces sp. NPDC058000 TaxID=3346299 RepID=UPI0036E7AAF1